MMSITQFSSRYDGMKLPDLHGRFFPVERLEKCISEMALQTLTSLLGNSVEGRPIYLLKFGEGATRVMAWSQMHGNETTTTKAVLDLLRNLLHPEGSGIDMAVFAQKFTFYVIPILNPDGAARFSRYNANGVDLNRDAIYRSQAESRILADLYDAISPDICLNLHGQRSIYGFEHGNPSLMSFLAPSADHERSITTARRKAISHIAHITKSLSEHIPGCVGRYDDGHNPHCVGDRFQSLGTPTILFEAGHSGQDYEREQARKYALLALMRLFDLIESEGLAGEEALDYYTSLPENRKNFVDVIFSNGTFRGQTVDLLVHYQEVLEGEQIKFIPRVQGVCKPGTYFGHKAIDLEGVSFLMNSHENVFVNEELLKITDKKTQKAIFSSKK